MIFIQYAIRNEGCSILQSQYAHKYSADFLLKCHECFVNSFVELIEEYSKMDVVVKNIKEQMPNAEQYINDRATISLDPFYHGTYNLRISRAFDGESDQSSFKELVIEKNGDISVFTGYTPDIPNGDYVLVDDDSVARETILSIINSLKDNECLQEKITQNKYCKSNSMMLFISKLRKGINIKDIYLLNQTSKGTYDTVDIRDFLFGVKYSGLVVKEKNTFIRKPYIYPFINLGTRAKIKNGRELSRKICLLNAQLYKRIEKITVSDTNIQFQLLMKSLGISGSTPMYDVCNILMEA